MGSDWSGGGSEEARMQVDRHQAKVGMEQYRIFLINGGGHIEGAHEFEAQDDKTAIKISEEWRKGRQMELWHLDRRVKHWG